MKQSTSLESVLKWAVGTIVVFLACVMFFPVGGNSKESSRRTACLSKVKQLAMGCNLYAEDNDDTLPHAKHWMDDVIHAPDPYDSDASSKKRKFTEDELHDVSYYHTDKYGYAYRARASAQPRSSITNPAGFALVFDSTLVERNANGDLDTVPKPGRHARRNCFGCLDGHAKSLLQP